MTEFDKNDSVVQRIWDRLRVLQGAKVFNIKSKKDLERVAKRYKTLSGFEKKGLIRNSNVFEIIKEQKMKVFVKGYEKNGIKHKGYYRPVTIRWTKKENIKLKSYVSKGRTPNQIASYLGRSPESIKRKIYKLKHTK